MNEFGRGLVLFSALLSPLAMADWLLNVNLELSSAGYHQSVTTSLQLLPGEETVIFGSATGDQGRKFFGSAELLEVSAEEVKIAFKIQEQLDDGAWRVLAAPVISTGLDTPASFETCEDDALNSVKLQVAVMSA
ncbi:MULTISPECIES: hypothetical protein [unclassified Photobacterium]|uniref:hypothetical protein n=1 Tax=unclassified Photobacterium TaxID=2628852 RepID=UPI001B8B5B2A|nr:MULTISPECIES: hypothetical protein [unclassified Photobacterium]MDO6705237.1 hypothetical protein [Photobacterium sp. 1_MG-2023]QUJ66740.1 hypothetical protein KDD30_11340 [Photobacterium sp. GJ3]